MTISLTRTPRRILVRATNWVGDAVMTLPALSALKQNFPEADIAVLAKAVVAPVYSGHPDVSGVMILDRNGRHRGMRGLWRAAMDVRTGAFDLAILFQNAFQAALIAWLARVPYRLGYNTDGRGVLLNNPIRLTAEDKRVHETEYYLRILRRAGLEAPDQAPLFHIGAQDRKAAADRMQGLSLTDNFILGLAPGASYGSAKRWDPDRFAEAADIILDRRPGTAFIFGAPAEAEIAARVAEKMRKRVVNLAGATGLAEAAALIGQCALFLTNDSGLMHVAAAVGTPVTAIFGSTNPVTTSPRGAPAVLVRHPVECSPCLKPECKMPRHYCMETITADDVAEAGLRLLSDQGG